MGKPSFKFFSVSPEFEDQIDRELAGYHAYLRGVKFQERESQEWQRGWNRARTGDKLTTRELRYIFR